MDRSTIAVLVFSLAVFVVGAVGFVQMLVKRRNPESVLLVGTLVLAAIVAIGVPLVNPASSTSGVLFKMGVTAAVVIGVGLGMREMNRLRKRR